MPEPNKPKFRLGPLSARASLLMVCLLMLGSPFLVLTFCLCIIYAVVPVSLWQKHSHWGWRTAIVLTCISGYGVITYALFDEMNGPPLTNEWGEPMPWMKTQFTAVFAGFIFLPLAAIGSLHSLWMHRNQTQPGKR